MRLAFADKCSVTCAGTGRLLPGNARTAIIDPRLPRRRQPPPPWPVESRLLWDSDFAEVSQSDRRSDRAVSAVHTGDSFQIASAMHFFVTFARYIIYPFIWLSRNARGN